MRSHQKRFLYIFVYLVAIPHLLSAQMQLNGFILRDIDKKPLSYANIGIENTTMGTISNSDGSFSLIVNPANLSDTLIIAALGYEALTFPVRKLLKKDSLVVFLKEKVTNIAEVSIESNKGKRRNYSRGLKYSTGGSFYTDSLSAGSAMALLISANQKPGRYSFIEKASLKIKQNTMKNFKVRIRIMELDTSWFNKPGKDLLHESFVVESGIEEGWITFDLSELGVQITQPSFFLVFEWIMEDRDRVELINQYALYRSEYPEKVINETSTIGSQTISYLNYQGFFAGTSFGSSFESSALNRYVCYYRTNSFGRWQRSPAILTARIFMSNQPFDTNGTK